jgi:ribosomal protein S18 acetylase RimI-like enzyme
VDDPRRENAASGFTIRPALGRDYAAFASLFPELEVDDPVPSSEAWGSILAPCTRVAVAGEDVIGYCFFQEYDDTGYIRHLAVAPRARRRGVGRALLQDIAGRLRRNGKSFWRLNVKPENHAALALYQGLGMSVRYAATSLRMPWTALKSLPAGLAVTRELAPARDSSLETLFDLPRGQLAYARKQGRLLLEAVSGSDEKPAGVAVFDASFPGAFPFRVVETDAVKPLLTAIRAQVPAHERVTLVAEDDARLRAMLIGVGATVKDEILHLKGQL